MDKIKIWYDSGAYEEVTAEHDRFAELAVIFAECAVNGRVTAAELCEGNGESQGFRRVDGMVTVNGSLISLFPLAAVGHGMCGRHGSRSVVRANDLKEHPSCARVPGHLGLHCNTVRYGAPGAFQWGDNECLPVDTP